MDFIHSQREQFPDLAQEYANLGTLYDKKLWHQLSLSLEEFVSDPKNVRDDNFLKLYENFITTCEARLNQVKLANLAYLVAKTLHDPAVALAFYEKVLVARGRLGTEATMCLEMDVVMIKVKCGDVDVAKDMLNTAKKQLPTIKSSDSVAFSKFYKATSEHKKVVGPPNEFYSAALMYLAYSHIDNLGVDEKVTLATDMALASITGEGIFNFGEVVATPILSSLKGTPNEWLQDLVLALDSGNVNTFNSILEAYKEQYFAQPVLTNKHEVIKEKVSLLSLVNIAFERPPHDRVIPFADIAARAVIPINQVESLLMRAMSLELVKGTLDEVAQDVSVTWVQPRVLGKEQISNLYTQLTDWEARVKTAAATIEDQTVELYE